MSTKFEPRIIDKTDLYTVCNKSKRKVLKSGKAMRKIKTSPEYWDLLMDGEVLEDKMYNIHKLPLLFLLEAVTIERNEKREEAALSVAEDNDNAIHEWNISGRAILKAQVCFDPLTENITFGEHIINSEFNLELNEINEIEGELLSIYQAYNADRNAETEKQQENTSNLKWGYKYGLNEDGDMCDYSSGSPVPCDEDVEISLYEFKELVLYLMNVATKADAENGQAYMASTVVELNGDYIRSVRVNTVPHKDGSILRLDKYKGNKRAKVFVEELIEAINKTKQSLNKEIEDCYAS